MKRTHWTAYNIIIIEDDAATIFSSEKPGTATKITNDLDIAVLDKMIATRHGASIDQACDWLRRERKPLAVIA